MHIAAIKFHALKLTDTNYAQYYTHMCAFLLGDMTTFVNTVGSTVILI